MEQKQKIFGPFIVVETLKRCRQLSKTEIEYVLHRFVQIRRQPRIGFAGHFAKFVLLVAWHGIVFAFLSQMRRNERRTGPGVSCVNWKQTTYYYYFRKMILY